MTHARGDVVLAADPFREENTAGRPFLVVSTPETPFHGRQYIGLSLTTKTWYEERIPLGDNDWQEGGAPENSSIMPWSVLSVRDELIERRQGTLHDDVVEDALDTLGGYIGLD